MSIENKERIAKLCADFSLLDDKDQEYIFGVLQALLFAKKKINEKNIFFTQRKRKEKETS
jgi:hypothetical protein